MKLFDAVTCVLSDEKDNLIRFDKDFGLLSFINFKNLEFGENLKMRTMKFDNYVLSWIQKPLNIESYSYTPWYPDEYDAMLSVVDSYE